MSHWPVHLAPPLPCPLYCSVLQPHLEQLKKFTYGKHIVSKAEALLAAQAEAAAAAAAGPADAAGAVAEGAAHAEAEEQ